MGGFLLSLLAFVLLWYFPHTLAHLAVGRLVGVRFSHFYVGPSGLVKLFRPLASLPFPVLGLKVEPSSKRLAARWRLRVMLLSGVLASMLLPLLTFAIPLHDVYRVILQALVLGNIAFTLPTSYLVGDIARALRA